MPAPARACLAPPVPGCGAVRVAVVGRQPGDLVSQPAAQCPGCVLACTEPCRELPVLDGLDGLVDACGGDQATVGG